MSIRMCGLAVVLAVSACGGDGGGDGGPDPTPTVAVAKADPSGDAQTAMVTQALGEPLRVVVTEDGTPKSDVTVSWSTPSGGTVEPASATTDADGIASTAWTLGQTAGAQTAQAAVTDASGSPVGFSATATAAAAAAAAAIESAGGDNGSGETGQALAQPFQVRVTDEFGNGVPDVSVSWSVTAGGGSIAPTTSTTGGDGTAAATLTLGPAPGTNTAEAASTGLTGSPVEFTAEATAAPAATVQVVNNEFQEASVTIDAGEVVRWSYAAGAMDHNIVPVTPNTIPTQPTFRDGPFTYQVAFPTPGTYKYYCANHGAVDGAGNTSGMAGVVVVQ